MRKGSIFLFILFIMLRLNLVNHSQAIPTFYGGSLQEDTWSRLLRTGVEMFESSADFQHHPWEPELVHRMADAGVKINFRLFWWWQFYNGEIAWNTSVVDLYYNETRMGLLEEFIDWQLDQLDPDKIWAVTLSEEEPGYALRYFWKPASQERYNDTYHEETGLWLKGQYDLNRTEERTLNRWLSEKTVHVFNRLYDQVKGRWPHILVFQFMGLTPGAPPVWGGGLDLTGLKADAFKGDLYYYNVYNNPFWLYEYVRHAKTAFPDKEYHFWIWGEEPWEEGGIAGGFEHIRRNTWVAYLAGVDAVGWFNWHYEFGVMWERDDLLGKQLIEYTNRLSRELGKLPTFRPQPEVLVIRDTPMCFQLGVCCELGLLHEWDSADQFTIVKGGVDLSRYRLVIANEVGYLDEVVEELNEYVRSGGNLFLLGGFGRGRKNLYENATREARFLMEEGVSQKEIWGETLLEIARPNPLDLELRYKNEVGGDCILALELGTLTDDHHAMGSYYETGGDGSLTPLDSSPLVLYHNSSNGEEGWVLYWGGQKTRTAPDEENGDVVEAFIRELSHTRLVYREVSRAFAGGFLGLRGCVAESGKENMLITQSAIGEGVILAGIMNHYPHVVDIDYVLDLGRFGLPPGEYWVHSLDQNTSLGRYDSQGPILEVPIRVGANGTRLLLISRQEPAPAYSVDTHPDIPSPEEVVGLWLPMLTVLSDHGEVTGGGSFKPGERISFGVSPEIVQGETGVRYVFTGWSSQDEGGYVGDENPAGVVMNWDVTETADWETQYYLTVRAEKWGSVTPGSGWLDAGSEVIVTAEPGTGFASWVGVGEGSYSGSEASHVVIMDGPIRETAVFFDDAPPVADAGSDMTAGVGENVAFSAIGSSDNAGIVRYEWDLGDGSKEIGPIVIHIYDSPGARTVTLTVKDAVGNSDTDTITVTVEEREEPGALKIKVPTWWLFIIGIAIALGLLPIILVKATSGER